MSAAAPLEFLKAQAIVARSWLVAMLAKKKAARVLSASRTENEIIVWQDVNDHEGFDVCADDHCQRYQGITRIISKNVHKAIDETRGIFLVHNGRNLRCPLLQILRRTNGNIFHRLGGRISCLSEQV